LSVFTRLNLSAGVPEYITPTIQPKTKLLTNIPICEPDSANSVLRKGTTPEIIAASMAKSKPPKAAIIEIKTG
jgi:hypothetical protein